MFYPNYNSFVTSLHADAWVYSFLFSLKSLPLMAIMIMTYGSIPTLFLGCFLAFRKETQNIIPRILCGAIMITYFSRISIELTLFFLLFEVLRIAAWYIVPLLIKKIPEEPRRYPVIQTFIQRMIEARKRASIMSLVDIAEAFNLASKNDDSKPLNDTTWNSLIQSVRNLEDTCWWWSHRGIMIFSNHWTLYSNFSVVPIDDATLMSYPNAAIDIKCSACDKEIDIPYTVRLRCFHECCMSCVETWMEERECVACVIEG